MIVDFQGIRPKVDPTAFIAETAVVIGDVEIGPGTNIWFHTIVRGDQNYIRIGSNCSIQDACILHVEKELPLIIEDEVAFGHRVVAHACKIRRGSLIGIGAIVLNGSEIGEESRGLVMNIESLLRGKRRWTSLSFRRNMLKESIPQSSLN